jgi:3-oxoacyl-[acyl-carrier protein] reductase
VALVTGGTGTLGEEIALALRGAGARVVVASRSRKTPSKRMARVLHGDRGVSFLRTDVARERSVAALEKAIRAQCGVVDVLVLAHGVQARVPFQDLTLAQWNAVVGTNLGGVFLACRQFIPAMRRAGWGRVVGVTSLTAEIGIRSLSAYGASKGGMAQFLRAVAVETAGDGVTVNMVAPGRVATRMTRDLLARRASRASTLGRVPLGRLAQPADVASAVLYLASENAGYVTGHTLVVDGGWTMSGGNPAG